MREGCGSGAHLGRKLPRDVVQTNIVRAVSRHRTLGAAGDLDSFAVSGTVVMKFGGTSVADAERLKRAARRIVAARENGQRVVAVLSARGKTTDELIQMAEEIGRAHV